MTVAFPKRSLVAKVNATPLVALARANAAPSLDTQNVTVATMADYLGISERQMQRWISGQQLRLSAIHADRIAVRLGRHPAQIFPDWFDEKAPAA